jgi:hypothetical protein
MIFLRSFSLVTVMFVLALASVTATAGKKTSEQCGHEFDQCQVRCDTDFKEDASRRALCVAKCSGLYTVCDASVAYDKAKPWLEEQAEKTKRFFEELLDK